MNTKDYTIRLEEPKDYREVENLVTMMALLRLDMASTKRIKDRVMQQKPLMR